MQQENDPFPSSRLWMRLGLVLFVIGLLTGFAVPYAALPRMALASHLEGLLNGILLIVVGLMWGRLHLGPRQRIAAFAAIVFAAYANWLATLLSSLTGAAGAMPLAGGGSTGSPLAEGVILLLLLSLSLAILTGAGLLIHGLRRVGAEPPAAR